MDTASPGRYRRRAIALSNENGAPPRPVFKLAVPRGYSKNRRNALAPPRPTAEISSN